MNNVRTTSIPLEQWLKLQARLLTSRKLRDAFRESPRTVCESLGFIGGAAAHQMPVVDIEGIEAQAQTLIKKRWHEVSRLLALPGDDVECRRRFADYAETFWPEGHHRHELDALAFADHLTSQGFRLREQWRVNLLRFRGTGRSTAIYWVRSLPVSSRFRSGIQIIHRRKQRVSQMFLHLAL